MSIEQEPYQFGAHHPKDNCKVSGFNFRFSNISTTLEFEVPIGELAGYKFDLPVRFPIHKVKEGKIANQARQKLAEFVLSGGTQNEPMAHFSTPNVFDPAQYPRDTIVRIFGEYECLDSELPQKHRYIEDINSLIFHAKHKFDLLGIITEGVKSDSNVITTFNGNEDEIVLKGSRYAMVDLPTQLGEWQHSRKWNHGLGLLGFYHFRPPFFNPSFWHIFPTLLLNDLYNAAKHSFFTYVISEDRFELVDGVDILQIGQGVREKRDARVKNSISRLSVSSRTV